jgi:hypothetical protein
MVAAVKTSESVAPLFAGARLRAMYSGEPERGISALCQSEEPEAPRRTRNLLFPSELPRARDAVRGGPTAQCGVASHSPGEVLLARGAPVMPVMEDENH